MIINIKNKNDLITLDYRTKQIRYLKDIEQRGQIYFIDLNNDDIQAYEYLFKEDKPLFLKSLKEDIKSNLNLNIQLKNCEVLKWYTSTK